MPLVKVSLLKGKTKEYKQAIFDSTYSALRNAFNAPENSQSMLINEYEKENFLLPKNYLGIEHTNDIIMIEIIANAGRSQDQKKALYAEITENLVKAINIRQEDVLINIVEVPKENWCMGKGVAAFV